MLRLCEKIREVRTALVNWSSHVFGRPKQLLQKKLSSLENLKKANVFGLYGDQLRVVEKEVDDLLLNDEVYGGSALTPPGSRWVTVTPSSSTNMQVIVRRKI